MIEQCDGASPHQDAVGCRGLYMVSSGLLMERKTSRGSWGLSRLGVVQLLILAPVMM